MKADDVNWRLLFVYAGVFVGFLAALIYHRSLSTLGHPWNTFLFNPNDRFNDFFNMYEICKNGDPYFENYFIVSNYFPLANLLFMGFALLPKMQSFVSFTTIYSLCLLAMTWRMLRVRGKLARFLAAFCITFFSFGYVFCVDRGNMEGFLLVFLMAFAVAYTNQKPYLAAFFLAIPVAMKLYPAVFLMLFVRRRLWLAGITVFFWVTLLSVVALAFHKHSFMDNLGFILNGFGSGNQNRAIFSDNPYFVFMGVSLFTPFKIFLVDQGLLGPDVMKLYFYGIGILTVVFSTYVVFAHDLVWRKFYVLVVMMLAFPHISFDYKLIHLALPLIFFFNEKPEVTARDLGWIVVFVLLLIPKAYYYFSDHASTPGGIRDIPEGAVINPILLLVSALAIVITGLLRRLRGLKMPEQSFAGASL